MPINLGANERTFRATASKKTNANEKVHLAIVYPRAHLLIKLLKCQRRQKMMRKSAAAGSSVRTMPWRQARQKQPLSRLRGTTKKQIISLSYLTRSREIGDQYINQLCTRAPQNCIREKIKSPHPPTIASICCCTLLLCVWPAGVCVLLATTIPEQIERANPSEHIFNI